MKKTMKCFAALRQTKDDKHQWIDLNTVYHTAEKSKEKADQIHRQIQPWSEDNPVIGIIPIEITYTEK